MSWLFITIEDPYLTKQLFLTGMPGIDLSSNTNAARRLGLRPIVCLRQTA